MSKKGIQYYLLRHPLSVPTAQVETMLGKTDTKVNPKAENTLHKLQELKSQVLELKSQFEELRKILSEDDGKKLLCSECGKAIELGQEVVVRSSSAADRTYYHKECFQALLA